MLYIVTKRMEISAAHKLELEYDSPCSRLHGHNWIVVVEVSSEHLNKEGMVVESTSPIRYRSPRTSDKVLYIHLAMFSAVGLEFRTSFRY